MDEQRVENLLAIIEGHGYPGEVAWLNSLKDRVQPKQGEQKPAAWSEKDNKMSKFIGNAITADDASIYLESKGIQIIDAHIWLEELEERVQQPKRSWSEEDEKTIVKMRDFFIGVLGDKPDFTEDKRYEEFIEFIDNRLKSLRPQKLLTNEKIEQAKKEYRDVALSKMDYIPEELTYDDGWDDAISYIEKVFKTLYLTGSRVNEND